MAVRQEPLHNVARRAKQAYKRAGRFIHAFYTHMAGCQACALAVRHPLRPLRYCEAGDEILRLAHVEIYRADRLQIEYEREHGHDRTADFRSGTLLDGVVLRASRALAYRFADDPRSPKPALQREYEEYGSRLRGARSGPEITSWLPVLIDLELPLQRRG
jgi:hypothetical protein